MVSNLKEHIHFLGICGTAMGALASAMKRKGFTVTGSDAKVYPPMSTFLEGEGIKLTEGYAAENVPAAADVAVIGNAMSRGNVEVEEVLNQKRLYVSLPELMKEHFLRGKRNFVVAGTHGKTTTTSLLAWLFESAGREPSYMIGGIPRNLGRGGHFTDSEFTVIEGDEYDTAFFDKRSKFLHYLPEVAVINNIEFDHADIYDSLDEIKLTFRRLLLIVPQNGLALVNGDDLNCCEVAEGAPGTVKKVGLTEGCDLQITDIAYEPSGSAFTLDGERYVLPMIGEFNVRNAAMAATAARFGGLSPDEIRAGFAAWQGIARRQELRGEVDGIKVIDDFAHHPTALALAIEALRQQYPESRIRAIFEPRSNTTRRNIFQAELAKALATADEAIVARIEDTSKVPEEEQLDEARLMADIASGGTSAFLGETVQSIVDHVADTAESGDVIAVLTNGGFENIHTRLLEALELARTSRA